MNQRHRDGDDIGGDETEQEIRAIERDIRGMPTEVLADSLDEMADGMLSVDAIVATNAAAAALGVPGDVAANIGRMTRRAGAAALHEAARRLRASVCLGTSP